MAQITFTNAGGITTTGKITSPTATISSNVGVPDKAIFSVSETYSLGNGQYGWGGTFCHPNMGSNSNSVLIFGKSLSTKNSAFIGYHYVGSASNDNYLTLGQYDVPHQMIIKTTGEVGIATTAPSYKLDVNGDIRSQSKAYIGTGGAYMQYTAATESIDFNFA